MDFFGNPDAGDVQDLIRAKDFELTTLRDAYVARGGSAAVFTPAGGPSSAADPDAHWSADTTALVRRYDAARAAAANAISNVSFVVFGGPALQTYSDVYEAILRAVQQTDKVVSPGDLQDVWTRLANVEAIHEAPAPQPGTPDEQLRAYQAVDHDIRAAEKKAREVAAAVGPPIAVLLVAAVAAAWFLRK